MGKNFLIECACGCNGIRCLVDKTYTKRIHIYIAGHNNTGNRGKHSNRWKGGRTKRDDGYWCMYKPDHHFCVKKRYVLEHRLVYEEAYACSLLPWADCHHIDGNRDNNNIQNLIAMMHGNHSRIKKEKLKGHIPWNKGIPRSKETKSRVSAALIAAWQRRKKSKLVFR